MLRRKKSYLATRCQHQTVLRAEVVQIDGSVMPMKLRLEDGKVEYCLNCLAGMAIRCAWCRQPIFIGETLTLYSPGANFIARGDEVVFRTDPVLMVGCMRIGCGNGGDRDGFWWPDDTGHGRVVPVMSPLEQALGTGRMVIVPNLSDISEATRPR